MSRGSTLRENPYLVFFGPFVVSFFEFGKQILRLFVRKEIVSLKFDVFIVTKEIIFNSFRVGLWICELLIDIFALRTFLIEGAISQQSERMGNGSRQRMAK